MFWKLDIHEENPSLSASILWWRPDAPAELQPFRPPWAPCLVITLGIQILARMMEDTAFNQRAIALYLCPTKPFHHESQPKKTVTKTLWGHFQPDLSDLIIKATSLESPFTCRNRRLIVTNSNFGSVLRKYMFPCRITLNYFSSKCPTQISLQIQIRNL